MIIWKDEIMLLDTDAYKLNIGISDFNDYKGASEKLIKTESVSFNDVHIYRPNTFNGYSTTMDIIVRESKKRELIHALRKGNRLTLPREKGKFREYYLDGEIKNTYYNAEFTKITVPLYLKAFVYERNKYTTTVSRGTIKIIENTGDVYAEPVYTIRGTGILVFLVNGVRNIVTNAEGGYIINCKNKEQNVTDLRGNAKNVTSEYVGNFSVFESGRNQVQLIQGDSLEIEVYWRNLD